MSAIAVVARAESRVLDAARAVHADVTQRQLASVTWTGPSLALDRLDELMEAIGDLAAADEAAADCDRSVTNPSADSATIHPERNA